MYQRNVGILEKIAQQLLTTTSLSKKEQRDELEQQYVSFFVWMMIMTMILSQKTIVLTPLFVKN